VAAETGNLEIIELLLQNGADVNKGGPIAHAARMGHYDAVELLLQQGADPNEPRTRGVPWSILSAAREGHLDILRLLIADGARVPDKDTANLVGEAARYGQRDVVEWLIRHGHPSDRRNSDGRTPLWLAAQGGLSLTGKGEHLEVVKLLVANGARLDARDNSGKTPLDIARERGHTEVVAYLEACTRAETRPASEQNPAESLPTGS
jgi:ankyrin repeat protein